LIDHTWIVHRATGSCDERQPAGQSRLDRIANVGFMETTLHTRFPASGRFRRKAVAPIAGWNFRFRP
jgi:hypothetical protein